MNSRVSPGSVLIDRTTRRGSAALIMILILVLLAGTYAATVGRRAASEQRAEYARQVRIVLQSAIDAVAATNFRSDTAVRLPLDSEGHRWIIVERVALPGGQELFQAVIFKDGKALQSLLRPIREDE